VFLSKSGIKLDAHTLPHCQQLLCASFHPGALGSNVIYLVILMLSGGTEGAGMYSARW
jgi:hypothetical protein